MVYRVQFTHLGCLWPMCSSSIRLFRMNCEKNGDSFFPPESMERAFQGLILLRNETVLTVIFLYFSLLGAIIDKGPSIIVIKDQDGYIFGGFASTSWTISPQFTGMYPSWSSVSSISTCVSLYLQDRRKISSSPWHRKWPSTLRRVSMITISISISNSKHSQTDW